jgi:hypothetical protein
MSQDRECFAFSVLIGQPVEIFFPGLIAFEEECCRLAEGPLEMGIADLLAAWAVLFAVGFLGTLYQPAGRDEVLDGREAVDVFNLFST